MKLQNDMIISNRYQILHTIGIGGTSNVYCAMDLKLERKVTCKVLKEEFIEEEFIGKFDKEARAAARISHINIASVYDVGNDGDIYYIVMEYVEGYNLKQIIKNKPKFPNEEVLVIAMQIANALEVAHNAGIVHRDIKPQNILVTEDGEIKVTDFGIARISTSNTITVETMGSAHYFSPEQARGAYVDARTDIYSLGIVMFEMVTGQLPFQGDGVVQLAMQHINNDLPDIRNYNSYVTPSIEKIIIKATAKHSDRRYSSAKEFREDIKKALSDTSGEFVESHVVDEESLTVVIKSEELEEINKMLYNSQKNSNNNNNNNYSNTNTNAYNNNNNYNNNNEYYDSDYDDAYQEYDLGNLDETIKIDEATRNAMLHNRTTSRSSRGANYYNNDNSENNNNYSNQDNYNNSYSNQDNNYSNNNNQDNNYSNNYSNQDNNYNYNNSNQDNNYNNNNDQDNNDDYEEKFNKSNKKKKSSKSGNKSENDKKIIILAVITSFIIIVTVTVIVFYKIFGGTENVVPDFTNKTWEEALVLAQASEVYITPTDEAYSTTIKEGSIITQSIAKGTIAERGDNIEVTLSLGTNQFAIADFVGLDIADVYRRIEDIDVIVKEEYIYDKDTEIGKIIRQLPTSGSNMNYGATLTLYVSRGEEVENIVVPNIVGFTEDAARSRITQYDLKVGYVSTSYSNSVEAGRVISQSINYGNEVAKYTTISFVVSLGKEPETTTKEVTYTTTEKITEATTKATTTTTQKEEDLDIEEDLDDDVIETTTKSNTTTTTTQKEEDLDIEEDLDDDITSATTIITTEVVTTTEAPTTTTTQEQTTEAPTTTTTQAPTTEAPTTTTTQAPVTEASEEAPEE